MKADHLVIGAGVAGLTYAIKTAMAFPERSVVVLNKSAQLMSNTRMAQGGIAVVTDQDADSIEQHVQDTLEAGAGMCDEQAVRTILAEGPERIQEMIEWGVQFDAENGKLMLGREGGHHQNRIVHKGDQTGLELAEVLLSKLKEQPNIQLINGHMACDLLMHDGKCIGAHVLNPGRHAYFIYSAVTVLATGGVGQVYGFTTNPPIATGDGLAMAHRVGANISNMEFIQFHPTALSHPKMAEPFLISEAVRGAGARLKNTDGEYFMKNYHELEDLAPRDVVSRAVFNEMEKTGADHVLLDCSPVDEKELQVHFPAITQKCSALGLDIRKDPIPVKPSAHYACGGIDTDLDGRTNISGLYAIGECANTGLHGANRLASNSLLEAMVMAHRCHLATKDVEQSDDFNNSQEEKLRSLSKTNYLPLKKQLNAVMEQKVGIVRSSRGLRSAQGEIASISSQLGNVVCEDGVEAIELRNLLIVAKFIVEQSLRREENVGGFFRSDLN
ncbi:MAG: L-aspartate oxidase [Flavobacteriales bacterium]|nr:L-aspartate oxidase [Flavobacteriales bacterium]